MADAAIELLLETLINLTTRETKLIFGVDGESEKLSSNLRRIQAVLEDAELNPNKIDRAGRDWLIKLRDATFEVEDILDECNAHFSKAKHPSAKCTCCCFIKGTSFRHKIGMRMKRATATLDAIAAEHAKFPSAVPPKTPSNTEAAARQMGPFLSKTEPVIGREDEKEMIVDILVNQVKEKQEISILPIIGVGGLGKTTFARLVFNDPRVVEHFEKTLWACVSDNFDAVTLIRTIIESGKESVSNVESLPGLQQRLQDLLIQKRYLLVLDDVWNEDQHEWSELKSILSWGAAGSAIIVTTRLGNVSQIMGTLPAHNLKGLTEEQCWMLLQQCAFQSDEEQYPSLQVIGKQITKKCAGVPLAAKALGGLLLFHRSEAEWNRVKDNEVWKLPEETKIMSALRLSYQHLPLHLRKCFVYCAVFLKDSYIYKEDLIFRWMAHGYISSNGELEAEDIGEQIWNELIMRSLFQNIIINADGEVSMTTITMHDLVHDLAQSIMETKVPRTQLGTTPESESNWKIREVNFHKGYVAFPKSTQTLLDISSISTKYNRLRVLDTTFQKINCLPPTIGNLQHLRLLNLSWTKLRILPRSICGLWNLQVLNLNYCNELELICKKMGHLKNLRHLLLKKCLRLRETPSNIRESTYLRTLSKFIVGRKKGNRLEELEHLKLRGNLEIHRLDRVENLIDVKKANLSGKTNLHELSLHWDWKENNISNLRGESMDDMVLEALQPQSDIKHLNIYGFSGKHFPTWMKMSKMVKVEIKKCGNIVNLSPLEEMPNLQSLKLQHLAGTECIGHGGNEGSIYFPALRKLDLSELPKLKGLLEVEHGQKMCPLLEELTVTKCPILVLPSLTSLQKLDWANNSFPSELLKCTTNLKILEISYLDEQCLPMGWLHHNTNLEKINIVHCRELAEISGEVTHLQSLKSICLAHLPEMEHLPEVIKHLPSLEDLCLCHLNKLTSLPDWLGDLISLRILKISNCLNLESLPSNIRGMTNLQSLEIRNCPNLERQCDKETGRGVAQDNPYSNTVD